MNLKNILITILLLNATLSTFADPGHDKNVNSETYTGSAPFYTPITIPAANSNLVSVSVTIDIQSDQQITTVASTLNTTPQSFYSVFHNHPVVATPNTFFAFDRNPTNIVILNPGETNTVFYSFADKVTYTTTNVIDIVAWLSPAKITSVYGSTIDMGGGNCNGSATRLSTSGITVTVTYTYDDENEHQKKPKNKK